MSIASKISELNNELPQDVRLVAVSKFHPVEAIMQAYDAGQRLFGESRPQEFAAKVNALPSDIQWHFIGHLQTNKLKLVLPYAAMIQSVDSVHLLEDIEKWGSANDKIIRVLLELHLGAEETKHGLTEDEIYAVLDSVSMYPHVVFCGLMGMATNTDDESVIRADFERIAALKNRLEALHPQLTDFKELSIGMSEDYKIAVQCGATMVRIGSDIFGPRQY